MHFPNEMVDGWLLLLAEDTTGENGMRYVVFKDASVMPKSEIVTL